MYPPADDASSLEWLLFRQSQVLNRQQALVEVGRGALQNRLTRRQWQAAGRAVVVAHNGPLTRVQQLWIAVLSAGDGVLCGGLTALSLDGLRGYDRALIDLVVPAHRRVKRLPGVRVHRASVLPEDHVIAHAAPPRTSVARSVVDAAAWARTDDDAQAIVAAAFQQRRILPEELNAALAVLPRTRRRALVGQTARYAAGGAHSLSEIHFGRLCRRYGIPAPDQQVVRRDGRGVQRYLDAYWRRWCLQVEVDGAWHLEVRTWWADMRRQNDLWITGDRVLRFPAWAITHRPEEVAVQVRSALEAAGWRP